MSFFSTKSTSVLLLLLLQLEGCGKEIMHWSMSGTQSASETEAVTAVIGTELGTVSLREALQDSFL